MPSAPASAARAERRTVSRVVIALVPTNTGTRPLTVAIAARVMRTSSSSLTAHDSPLSPRTRKPEQPQSTCQLSILAKASSMRSPLALNGVTTAGTWPRTFILLAMIVPPRVVVVAPSREEAGGRGGNDRKSGAGGQRRPGPGAVQLRTL